MPSKKKKYNARFPAGRIKKIMQTDEEIGKVAQAVPVIISRTLELFVESLLTKTLRITNARNAKTLSPSHLKQCIMAENRFDFLRELVKNVPISDNQFETDPYGANHSNDNSSTNVSTASLSGGTNGQHPDEPKSNSVTPPVQHNHTPPPFNFYGSFDNKTTATPPTMPLSNNLNFYTEITSEEKPNCDTNRPSQHQLLKRANTTTAPSPFKPKLPKLTRLNSAPSTVTSTTIQQQPMAAAAPSTPQFTISIPTPQQLSQPVIKLDYSHLAQQFSAAAASTSFSNQQPVPTISIDFSNYSNATTTTVSAATASTNGLDEDYDDI